ncbi:MULTISPECIES: hypothetical protein [unclassified Nocardioides]|uniref:hypothetical protein n=1 Tax=unclassified Nocardioides TaxID=2615069 RepID=UPI00114F1EAC|nr:MULTISPECIES: hypothetical protein [unclassified Nocardioides]TQK71174.1 hypothetical protein FBY23_2962 [Nocardioides sp. SLBN-35]WGY04657.1 hypothetical protein QI633_12985 [Nocardioides sp. QY071]
MHRVVLMLDVGELISWMFLNDASQYAYWLPGDTKAWSLPLNAACAGPGTATCATNAATHAGNPTAQISFVRIC